MANDMDRRRFHELSSAVLSGLAAGVLTGCGSEKEAAKPVTQTLGPDQHLCRGLNDCKSHGQGGKNDCRGLSECATIASHSCGGQNECKSQGGCGDTAGANDCKGKGGCHVPLMDSAHETVRKRLEEKWKKAGEKFGDAPAKKEEA